MHLIYITSGGTAREKQIHRLTLANVRLTRGGVVNNPPLINLKGGLEHILLILS
jgi:hypothetical protein